MSNLWITPEELGTYAESEYAYEAAKAASNLLWALSGRKYSGTVTVTERYVCVNRLYRYGASLRNSSPQLLNGEVYNIPTNDFDYMYDTTSDGSSASRRVKLRGRPVQTIHTIRNIAGEIVDPSTYYLVDHSTLQATAGQVWVPCDIEVTYSYGIDPPTLGKMAARTMALEFAKLWNGDDDCILPQRVTSISRQGVSYTLLDNQEFIDDMRTGLYAVDMFLKSVNPDRARAKSRVFSPDIAKARRYTPKAIREGVSELDIAVPAATTGTASSSVSLASLNAQFLVSEQGWTPYAILRNYSETKSVTLTGAVTLVDPTPVAIDLATRSIVSNVATMTTLAAHNLYVGTSITIANADATFNGTYAVLSVLNSTTFTYAKTNENIAEVATTGTVSAASDTRLVTTVGYADAYSAIGKVDPGTYDVYADKGTAPNIETAHIGTGNLTIALASTAVAAIVIGAS